MSQIIIHIYGGEIVFGEWEQESYNQWYRYVLPKTMMKDRIGLKVPIWSGEDKLVIPLDGLQFLNEIYMLCYPGGSHPTFNLSQIEEAKTHVDNFLNRINTMRAFI